MRLLFGATAGLVALLSISAFAQQPQLAPEGRGLLPKPVEMPARLEGMRPPHAFEPDPSGGFSRIVFSTDEHPDFKLVIRDFSFPPDRKAHTITLPSSGVLHLLSGSGEVSIAKQPLTPAPAARAAVPFGAPIDVVNSGEQPV